MERPNSKGSHNFLVGMFVFVAALVSLGFVVFIGGSVFGAEFRVKSVFSDVRGLNIGAPVFLSGIQVGRVSEKQFPKGEPAEDGSAATDEPKADRIVVVLTMYSEHKNRIRSDSEVTITTQGVLGDKVVVVTPGSNGAEPVKEGMELKSIQPKEFSDYFAQGGNLVETLVNAALNLNALLQSINETGKVSSVLESADKTFKNMAAISEKLNSESGPLVSSAKNLDAILGKINRGEGTLGALVNDPSLHEDLRVLLGGAQRSTTVRFLLRQAIQSGDKDKK
jgi:phospholipid/cholesterol/gamma-HCH transport system substrate-binding protein